MCTAPRVAALLVFVSSCATVSVIPRYGRLNIDGSIGVNGASSGSSARNDYKAMGLQDDTSVPSGRVDLGAAGVKATFSLSQSSHGGTGTLQSDVSDGTTTIPAGTSVNTDFDVVLGQGIVTWDLVPGDLVEAGIGLGVSAFDVDARITNPAASQSIGAHGFLPVPVVAGRVGLDFGKIDVSLLADGMDVRADGKDVTLLDLDFMARWKLIGTVGGFAGALAAGYRYVDLRFDTADSSKSIESTTRLSGPWIGLSLGF